MRDPVRQPARDDGAAARDAIAGSDSSTGIYQQALKYVGLLATFAVVVIVTRIARKAMRPARKASTATSLAAFSAAGIVPPSARTS